MIHHSVLNAIDEALDALGMNTKQARVAMLAIGLQESRMTARRQLVGNPPKPVGPAKGLWQFERGGGCVGVLTHRSAKNKMFAACINHGVEPNSRALWDALEFNDVLAATAARLLLYTDPRPLPLLGDVWGMWDYYVDNWRPGKPHRDTWERLYLQAGEEEAARWPA